MTRFRKSRSEQICIQTTPFEPENQCMDVRIKLSDDLKHDFIKGAPEKLVSLLPNGMAPPEKFHDIVLSHAAEGYRVIAFGRGNMQRVEELIGLVVLTNRLKPETLPTMKKLNKADLRIIMITGDNMSTALNVAKKSELLKPHITTMNIESLPVIQPDDDNTVLSIDGSMFEQLIAEGNDRDLLLIAQHVAIFSSFSRT